MKRFRWPWQRKEEEDLEVFAKELETVFRPVQPREDFVRDLRDNLMDQPKPKWLPLPLAGWRLILVIAGGIISAFLLILGGVRLFTNLFRRKKVKPKKQPSSTD
jgi:hypothetical protein